MEAAAACFPKAGRGDGSPAARSLGNSAANEGSPADFPASPGTCRLGTPGECPPPPRLSNIRAIDFEDTGRALELYRQAVKCGLMPNGSEYSRLLWLAAIERARSVPAKNPAGVFLFVVKNRRWAYLSDAHFDAANARVKAFLYARPCDAVPFLVPRPDPQERAPGAPRELLSKDAQLVRTLLRRLGGQGRLFSALRAHAAWDRERYAAALAELEAAEKTPPLQTNTI